MKISPTNTASGMLPVQPQRFDPYDQQVLTEIARDTVNQPFLQKAVSLAGKPAAKIFEGAKTSRVRAIQKTASAFQDAILKAQLQTIRLARHFKTESPILEAAQRLGMELHSVEACSTLSLQDRDALADRLVRSNTLLMGFEGAIMGLSTSLAAYIPFAQVSLPGLITTDILLSMTLLARHTLLLAAVYGFPGTHPENIPHILAAMAPEREFTDEGYLASKALVVNAIRESAQFLAEVSGRELSLRLIQKRAPQLIKLMQYVAERVGLVLTEKQLSMGVPIAGALLNGGVNVAFQQLGHRTAKHYFRKMLLIHKYGQDAVQQYLHVKISEFLNDTRNTVHP